MFRNGLPGITKLDSCNSATANQPQLLHILPRKHQIGHRKVSLHPPKQVARRVNRVHAFPRGRPQIAPRINLQPIRVMLVVDVKGPLIHQSINAKVDTVRVQHSRAGRVEHRRPSGAHAGVTDVYGGPILTSGDAIGLGQRPVEQLAGSGGGIEEPDTGRQSRRDGIQLVKVAKPRIRPPYVSARVNYEVVRAVVCYTSVVVEDRLGFVCLGVV